MSYEPGTLLCLTPAIAAEIEAEDVDSADYWTLQERFGSMPIEDTRAAQDTPPPMVYLPHSCNSWVIGGPEQVRAMIADLQEALVVMESAPSQ